jgi:hypothetical protein
MKATFTIVGFVSIFFATIFGLNYLGYANFAFFAPRYEAVRRDVMINSRAYDEGTKRELYRLQLQYQQAKTDAERDTIASAARHEFQIFPQDRLPSDLRAFMSQIEGN